MHMNAPMTSVVWIVVPSRSAWKMRTSERPRPVLFLVHGSSFSTRVSYDMQIPGSVDYSAMNLFARAGYDVWTMDHDGYGYSGSSGNNSDIASGVADLKAAIPLVVKETGQPKMHFYGPSSGSIRAGAYAMIEPERVDRLVLVDDVTTTGATLEACAQALLAAGAREVRAITAARVSTVPR